jgi:hypothetical protein
VAELSRVSDPVAGPNVRVQEVKALLLRKPSLETITGLKDEVKLD